MSNPDHTSPCDRRILRFGDVDEMLEEARRLAEATRVEPIGRWTLGQALNHVAGWIEFPWTGYPKELVFDAEARAAAVLAKPRLMVEAMEPGERLPGIERGTLVLEVVPKSIGLDRLESAAQWLRGDGAAFTPHEDPAFGRITRREWMEINLRHAELHFGFFRIVGE